MMPSSRGNPTTALVIGRMFSCTTYGSTTVHVVIAASHGRREKEIEGSWGQTDKESERKEKGRGSGRG
jgi:hypothetical protein